MHKLSFLAFTFLLTLSPYFVTGANAQEETPTPTYEPLFVTGTAIPDVDYSCPPDGELPDGWMTVTPDAYWEFQCGICTGGWISATMTTVPTMTTIPPNTPGPGTPTWTPEPATTPTPTVAATPSGEIDFYFGDLIVMEVFDPNPSTSGQRTVDTFETFTTENDLMGVYYTLVSSNQDWGQTNFSPYEENGSAKLFNCCSRVGIGTSKFIINSVTVEGVYGNRFDACEALDPDALCGGNANIQLPGVFTGVKFWTTGPNNDDISTVIHVKPVYFGVEPADEPTPTPEPTLSPTPGGYCGSVKPEDGPAELGVSLPSPMVGPMTCYGIPYIDIPDVFGLNLEFPGMEVCFRPLIFGELQILDIFIDMDWLLSIIAGIWSIRMVLRS
jgi:hypothetical protein